MWSGVEEPSRKAQIGFSMSKLNVRKGSTVICGIVRLKVTHVFKNHFRTVDGRNWNLDGTLKPKVEKKSTKIWVVNVKESDCEADTTLFWKKADAVAFMNAKGEDLAKKGFKLETDFDSPDSHTWETLDEFGDISESICIWMNNNWVQ